jgi:hypothetical protein
LISVSKSSRTGAINTKDDRNDTDISKYKDNLGLPQESINEIKEKIPQELYPVLSIEEQEKFDLDKILHKINLTIGKMIRNHIDFS